MALDVGTLKTFINALVRIDSANLPISSAEMIDLIDEIHQGFHAAYGTRSGLIASGSGGGTSTFQFSGVLGVNDMPLTIDAIEQSTGGNFVPLDLQPEGYVRNLQNTEGRQGNPTMASIKYTNDSTTSWFLTGYLYPLSLAIVSLRIWGRSELATLSADGDVLGVTPQGFYAIGRIAAVQVAGMLKRPRWLLERIAEPIPEKVRLNFDVARLILHAPHAVARDVLPAVAPENALPLPQLSQLGDE